MAAARCLAVDAAQPVGDVGSTATRRFSRMRFKPRADLVIGMLDVTLFLSSAAYRRRRDDGSKRGPGAPAISEWALVDESPDGFGVRYIRGDIAAVEVGDVVALRPGKAAMSRSAW